MTELRHNSTSPEAYYGPRKEIYDGYFKTIDSHDKAYWLGFIMADGCLTFTGACDISLRLAIKESDIGHLKSFNKYIGSGYSIGIDAREIGEDIARTVITNGQFVRKLMKYGVVPRKSGMERPNFDLIPNDFIVDFWRGVVDGDGYISLANYHDGKYKYPSLGLSGSQFVCENFLEYVNGFVETNESVQCRESFYQIRFVGEQARKLIIKLYDEAYDEDYPYLERKMQKAINVFKECGYID